MADGLFLLLSVFVLYNDKEVKGFSAGIFIWYAIWGFWNIYYYSVLDLPLSVLATIFALTANLIYLAQIYYYSKVYPAETNLVLAEEETG